MHILFCIIIDIIIIQLQSSTQSQPTISNNAYVTILESYPSWF